MPIVHISLQIGKSAEYIKALADSVHQALVSSIDIPVEDRFQLIHEYQAQQFITDKTYLGIERSDNLVIIQIILRAGRAPEIKKKLYQTLANHLADKPGLRKEDVLVTLIENQDADWSFGNGIAQRLLVN
jgi:phenylpyruvate tautomerase PptA (4-oxalocrotonate tautomerase family)